MAALSDFVLETTNNPGTAAAIALAGAQPGRKTFGSQHVDGETVYFGMDDGTQAEISQGPYASGANTLERNVIWNSVGTTSRMNFTGLTYVYPVIPASRAVYVLNHGGLNVSGYALKRAMWGGNAGGTASAIAVTVDPSPGVLNPGLGVRFVATFATGGPGVTLSLNGLAAAAVKRIDGATDLPPGYLQPGQLVEAWYDGAAWRVMGSAVGVLTVEDLLFFGTRYGNTRASLSSTIWFGTNGADVTVNFGAARYMAWESGADRLAFVTAGKIWYMNPDGNALAVNGAWADGSDEALKTDRRPLGGDPRAVMRSLSGAISRYRRAPAAGQPPGAEEVGFLASKVRAALPEAVISARIGDRDVLGILPTAILAQAVAAQAALEAEVAALRSEVAALRGGPPGGQGASPAPPAPPARP